MHLTERIRFCFVKESFNSYSFLSRFPGVLWSWTTLTKSDSNFSFFLFLLFFLFNCFFFTFRQFWEILVATQTNFAQWMSSGIVHEATFSDTHASIRASSIEESFSCFPWNRRIQLGRIQSASVVYECNWTNFYPLAIAIELNKIT